MVAETCTTRGSRSRAKASIWRRVSSFTGKFGPGDRVGIGIKTHLLVRAGASASVPPPSPDRKTGGL